MDWICEFCDEKNESTRKVDCKVCGTPKPSNITNTSPNFSVEVVDFSQICPHCGYSGIIEDEKVIFTCGCTGSDDTKQDSEPLPENLKTSSVTSSVTSDQQSTKNLFPVLLFDDNQLVIKERKKNYGRKDFIDLGGKKIQYISRKHFSINKMSKSVYIENISKKNWLKINGERLEKGLDHELLNGDSILVPPSINLIYLGSDLNSKAKMFSRPPCLEFLPKSKNKQIQLKNGVFYLDRETLKPHCDPNLLKYISHKHLKIIYYQDWFLIEDGRGTGKKGSGSSNGTLLNGKEIKNTGLKYLKPGDTITLGKKVSLKVTKEE